LIDSDAARHNFSNEGGAFGTIRFLKNVMGLWILESCRREWEGRGHDVSYESLLREAEAIPGVSSLIFPDDRRFFNPASMLDAITCQLAETGQRPPTDPAAIAKIILDSLALRYASVLRTAEALTRRKIAGVQIVGGGSRNQYLNQATATVTGLPVRAGPVEATVTGNVLVQAIAGGRFDSLAAARRHVAHNLRLAEFAPRPSAAWDDAARRYAAIEERYLSGAAA
jgi:rhamnulokinase